MAPYEHDEGHSNILRHDFKKKLEFKEYVFVRNMGKTELTLGALNYFSHKL